MTNEQDNQQLASDLRTVITRLIKKLRTKSATGAKLSLTERSTLALLDVHKELLPSELAAMEKITTQSMSQILNHLFELGYIHRRISKLINVNPLYHCQKRGKQFYTK
ncbi:MAG: helix-turn-helix domain-containing protein [Ferruginibacter sp.]